MDADRHVVFVYGTLKRGGANHHYLVGQHLIGEAETGPGWTLYELAGYPGMVPEPGGQDKVRGEVWDVDRQCLAELDVLEGLDEGLYTREPVIVHRGDTQISAETYVYARDVAGCARIGSVWPV